MLSSKPPTSSRRGCSFSTLLTLTSLLVVAAGCDPSVSGALDGGTPNVSYTGSVSVDRASAPADGVAAINIIISLRTSADAPVPGVFVNIGATGSGNIIGQPAVTTDAQGRVVAVLRSTVAGEKVVTATATVGNRAVEFRTAVSVTFTPTNVPGATKLAFLTQPSNVVAGALLAPPVRVALQGADGATVASATGAVTLTLVGPAGGVLAGTRTANAVAGVVTFSDLSVAKAGAGFAILAVSPGLTNATSTAFNVTAGSAAKLAFVDQPMDAEAGAAFTDVTVEARDAQDNLVTGYSGAVTLAVGQAPSGATLLGTPTATAANGVAVFDDLAIEKAAAAYTLVASAANLTGATSAPFAVLASDLDHFTLGGLPAEMTAGQSVTLSVAARDAYENAVILYSGTIRFSSSDPAAVLPAAYTFVAADAGVHSFASVSLRTAGARTLSVTDSLASAIVATASTQVATGAPSRLAFTVQPSAGTVRAPISPAIRVSVTDAYGNRVSSTSPTVALSLAPVGGVLGGTTGVVATGGLASFDNVTVANEASNMVLTASAPNLLSVSSAPFTITDNLAPSQPAGLTATTLDRSTVGLDWLAPGDDGLFGALAPIGGLGAPGFYRLCYTRQGSATQTCTQSGQGGFPAPAEPGQLEGFDVVNLAAGTQYTFRLTAIDGAQNSSTVATAITATDPCPTGYGGDTCDQCATGFHRDPGNTCVDVCSSPNPCGTPTLSSCANATTLTTYANPGACSVTSPGQFTCSYAPIAVNCATNGQVCLNNACVNQPPVFEISALAMGVNAGEASSFTLAARSPQDGQLLAGYRGTVRFTSNDPQAVLPANYTFTSADGGVHMFSAVWKTAGAGKTVIATDTEFATATTSASVVVQPAAVTGLTFVVQPSAVNVRASLAPSLTVALRDAFGNVATNTLSTSVSIAPGNNPGNANLTGETTLGTVLGVAQFAGLKLDNEGTGVTLVASSEGLPNATSAPFTVTDNLAPAAPSAFAVTVTSRFSVSVDWHAAGDDGNLGDPTAQSRYRFCYTRENGTAVCANSGQANVPTPDFQDKPEGFFLEGLAAGTRYTFTLTMTDPASNVSPSATAVATTDPCEAGYSGDSCDQCAAGFHRDGGNLCVDACTSPNPCTTPTANTCANATTATVFASPGTCSLGAVAGQTTCTYAPSSVNCATGGQVCFQGACIDPPPLLVLTGVPTVTAAGGVFAMTLTAKNPQNQQTLTSYRGTVRFASSDGQAALPGDYAFTAADNGVHTFAGVSLRTPGTARTLTATDTGNAASTTTVQVNVNPGAVTSLSFTSAPQGTAVRTTLSPAVVVTLRDALGNLATNATGNVLIAIGNNPKGAVLGGTTSIAVSNGVANFANLSLDNEGVSMTLVASYAVLTPVPSAAFTVTDAVPPAQPDSLSVVGLGTDTLLLDWVAPGDDGNLGNLSNGGKYRICYTRQGTSTPVCAESGTAAVPVPAAPGSLESYDIVGLAAGSQYAVTITAIDGAGNASLAATGTASTDPCAAGYIGDSCDQCAVGYHRDGGNSCVDACTSPNPCGGPPVNSCAADVATSYLALGVCSTTAASPFFSCGYPPIVTNCQATQKRCFGGACFTDLCLSTPCTAAPGPACGADGVSVVSTSLVCAMPTSSTRSCSYPTTTVACGPQVCNNGACATAVAPSAGELLISEVMHTPSAGFPNGEWFEVKNTTNKLLNIAGMVVADVDATTAENVVTSFTVSTTKPVLVQPGGYFVFAASSTLGENGIAGVGYSWGGSGFVLNGSARLRLRFGATLVESLTYSGSYPQTAGKAMQLSSKAQRTQQPQWYWCDATTQLSTGDFGTPGAANGDCGMVVTAPVDFCAIQFPDTLPSAFSGVANTVFARVFDPNVTTRNQSGNDGYPFLVAQIGFGASVNPATWTWTAAGFNSGYNSGSPGFVSNDDELQGSVSFPAAGTYFYGFRVRLDDPTTGAAGTFAYCDQLGVVPDPLTDGVWGVASVTVAPPTVASVNFPVAPRGSSLRLTGTFFGAATAVTIGGTAQVFTVDSATQISISSVAAATPTGSQSVVVSASTVNSNNNITVDVRAFAADIPGVTMPSGVAPAFAHGGRLRVTSTGLTGASAVTIGGVAQTFTVSSDTSLTVTNLADATPVDLQGVSITTAAGATAPVPVTVIHLVIYELDADQPSTDTVEFIEVSTGLSRAVSLNGYFIVLYNGGSATPAAGDTSYSPLIDLGKNGAAAVTTKSNGLLVAGNANVPGNDIAVFSVSGGTVSLQNGPDAIAIHQGVSTGNITLGTTTATQAKANANLALIDALLYDAINSPTTTLPVPGRAITVLANVLLGDGASCTPTARCAVVNEGVNTTLTVTTSTLDSIQRCSTARLDSRAFSKVGTPSAGTANTCP